MRLLAHLSKIRTDVKKNRLFGIPIRPEPGQRPGLQDAPPWAKKWLPRLGVFTAAGIVANLVLYVYLFFFLTARDAAPVAVSAGLF